MVMSLLGEMNIGEEFFHDYVFPDNFHINNPFLVTVKTTGKKWYFVIKTTTKEENIEICGDRTMSHEIDSRFLLSALHKMNPNLEIIFYGEKIEELKLDEYQFEVYRRIIASIFSQNKNSVSSHTQRSARPLESDRKLIEQHSKPQTLEKLENLLYKVAPYLLEKYDPEIYNDILHKGSTPYNSKETAILCDKHHATKPKIFDSFCINIGLKDKSDYLESPTILLPNIVHVLYSHLYKQPGELENLGILLALSDSKYIYAVLEPQFFKFYFKGVYINLVSYENLSNTTIYRQYVELILFTFPMTDQQRTFAHEAYEFYKSQPKILQE